MPKKPLFQTLVLLAITLSITGCDALTRSKFQNDYIKRCNAEGRFSSDRCECFAEKIDAKFDDKEKQLVLNPSDNPLALFALSGPLLEISSQCQDEGR